MNSCVFHWMRRSCAAAQSAALPHSYEKGSRIAPPLSLLRFVNAAYAESRLPLHRKADRITATETQAGDSLMYVATNHLIEQRGEDARSAGPYGMSQRHRATVHVDLV